MIVPDSRARIRGEIAPIGCTGSRLYEREAISRGFLALPTHPLHDGVGGDGIAIGQDEGDGNSRAHRLQLVGCDEEAAIGAVVQGHGREIWAPSYL